MKYTIHINQLVLSKTKLDIIDAGILDYIGFICGTTNDKIEKERITENDYRWTWINLDSISKQMPLLRINSSGAFTRRIKKITDAGYIQTIRKSNQRLYARLSPKYDELLIDINSSQAQAIDVHQQSCSPTSTDKEYKDKDTVDKEEASPHKRAYETKARSIAWLTSMSKDDIIKWTTTFPELPEGIIKREAEKAYLWLEERKGGVSKNPNLFFHNWLDKVVDRVKNGYAQRRPTITVQT